MERKKGQKMTGWFANVLKWISEKNILIFGENLADKRIAKIENPRKKATYQFISDASFEVLDIMTDNNKNDVLQLRNFARANGEPFVAFLSEPVVEDIKANMEARNTPEEEIKIVIEQLEAWRSDKTNYVIKLAKL
ncbi:MAG: hypothetical protein ACPGXZ_00695 [Saprospiraceae bacterium]